MIIPRSKHPLTSGRAASTENLEKRKACGCHLNALNGMWSKKGTPASWRSNPDHGQCSGSRDRLERKKKVSVQYLVPQELLPILGFFVDIVSYYFHVKHLPLLRSYNTLLLWDWSVDPAPASWKKGQ